MNTQTLNTFAPDYPAARHLPSVDRYPARARFILKMLSGLQHGALQLELPDGQSAHFGDHSHPVCAAPEKLDDVRCGAALG